MYKASTAKGLALLCPYELVGVAVGSDAGAVGVGVSVETGVLVGVSVGTGVPVAGTLVALGTIGASDPPTAEPRTTRGATHSARSPIAEPLARTVRMKLTFCPAREEREISAG